MPTTSHTSTDAYECLLANEEVLIVNPVLAQSIGLEPSLLLKQLAYWLNQNEKKARQSLFQDGRWWSFGSYQQWRDENFPFLSVSSIRRLFAQLENLGLVLSSQKYNPNPMIQSKWYSIDIQAYNAFMSLWETVGKPSANESKPESKAAYAHFLEDWKEVRANLTSRDTGLDLHSQGNSSFTQNPADGVQPETFAQEAFIPPHWKNQNPSIPHQSEMSATFTSHQQEVQADAIDASIPRQPEILDGNKLSELEMSTAITSRQLEAQTEAIDASIPRQPEILDGSKFLKPGMSAAFTLYQPEDSHILVPRQSELAEPATDMALQSSDLLMPDEQLSSQTEQGDSQTEQLICSEETAHLPKLSSPIKETIEEINQENQKEIQKQEIKAIASQGEAYVPARIVKDSQILNSKSQSPSSKKAKDGVGQDEAEPHDFESSKAEYSTQTLGARILNYYTSLELESQESGFARAASTKNEPDLPKAKSSKPAASTQGNSKAAPQAPAQSPKPQAAAQTQAENLVPNPAAKAKMVPQPQSPLRGNAGKAAQKPAAKPKGAPQAESTVRGNAGKTAQKPSTQDKSATGKSQTADGGTARKAAQNGRAAAETAEAKRLRTAGAAVHSAKTDAAPNLYAEVVRRVFSSPQELLQADSAFVWLWIGFFRGSLKETPMKSHKSHQLSEAPMDPATILAFSHWYCERYKQESLPRSPETLRARCDEFRALPSMERWLEKGRASLEALKAALAKGVAPAPLAKLGTNHSATSHGKLSNSSANHSPISHSNGGKAMDTSDMQDFDWKNFFEGSNDNENEKSEFTE